MSIGERALGVLACRHVDDIVFDALVRPSSEFLRELGISLVLRISGHEDFLSDKGCEVLQGRWCAVEEAGLLSDLSIDGAGLLVTAQLLQRVVDSQSQLQERQLHKVRPKPVHIARQT